MHVVNKRNPIESFQGLLNGKTGQKSQIHDDYEREAEVHLL